MITPFYLNKYKYFESKSVLHTVICIFLIEHPVTDVHKNFAHCFTVLHDLLTGVAVDLNMVIQNKLIEYAGHHTCGTIIAISLLFLLSAHSLMNRHNELH